MPLRSVTSVNRSARVAVRATAIVAIEAGCRADGPCASPAGPGLSVDALDDEDVEVAVVVEVEERAAAADHFRQEQLTTRAVDVDEVEAGVAGLVDEERARLLRGPERCHDEQRQCQARHESPSSGRLAPAGHGLNLTARLRTLSESPSISPRRPASSIVTTRSSARSLGRRLADDARDRRWSTACGRAARFVQCQRLGEM